MEKNSRSRGNAVSGQEDTIDLLELANVFLAHIIQIAVCVIIGAVLVGGYAYFFIHPTYTATAKLYVVSASSDSVVNLSDLNIGTNLTKDYEELIKSYPVMEEVIYDLELNMNYNQLNRMVSLSNPANTRVLYITATAQEPELARDIANKVSQVAVNYLPEVMSTNAPNIAQRARTPEAKTGPSYTRYTMIGAVIGLLLALGYYTIRHLMDDTIHSAEEMEKYFDIVPLTSVPENKALWDTAELEHSQLKKHIRGRSRSASKR